MTSGFPVVLWFLEFPGLVSPAFITEIYICTMSTYTLHISLHIYNIICRYTSCISLYTYTFNVSLSDHYLFKDWNRNLDDRVTQRFKATPHFPSSPDLPDNQTGEEGGEKEAKLSMTNAFERLFHALLLRRTLLLLKKTRKERLCWLRGSQSIVGMQHSLLGIGRGAETVSNPVGLGWGLGICISKRLAGSAGLEPPSHFPKDFRGGQIGDFLETWDPGREAAAEGREGGSTWERTSAHFISGFWVRAVTETFIRKKLNNQHRLEAISMSAKKMCHDPGWIKTLAGEDEEMLFSCYSCCWVSKNCRSFQKPYREVSKWKREYVMGLQPQATKKIYIYNIYSCVPSCPQVFELLRLSSFMCTAINHKHKTLLRLCF